MLQQAWKNIQHTNIIEILPSTDDYEDIVDSAIANEKDTLIFLGHGTTKGLLFPDLYRGAYLIHENNVELVEAKNIICAWCYASSFVQDNGLHNCFATSMFISNEKEAYENLFKDYGQDYINSTSRQFYAEVNELLRNGTPLDQWVMILGARMDIENPVDCFNRQGLYYQE